MIENPRIGYDIDDVLSNFKIPFITRMKNLGQWKEGMPDSEEEWNTWEWPDEEAFSKTWKSIEADYDWWLSLPIHRTVINKDLYNTTVYITSRPIPSFISKEWLNRNGFPDAPVETVKPGHSKAEVVKNYSLDYFVDDSLSNFIDINRNTDSQVFMASRSHNNDPYLTVTLQKKCPDNVEEMTALINSCRIASVNNTKYKINQLVTEILNKL